MLLHQSNGTLTDFRGKLVVLAHDCILSRNAASSKPGVIQSACTLSLFVFDTMLKNVKFIVFFSIQNNNLVKFNTMKIQKRAAWYRLPSWHRQSIVPALMPCSNGAWRFLLLPDRARLKKKKARNYAGLAAFYAIKCLAVPDAGSFPLYRRRRFAGDVVRHAIDAAHFV